MLGSLDYPIMLDDIGHRVMNIQIAANSTQKTALAQRLGVSEVEELAADVTLRKWRKVGVRVALNIHTRLVTPCSRSNLPISQTVEIEEECKYLPSGAKNRFPSNEVVIESLDEDEPEILDGDLLNLWDVVVEFTDLNIDRFAKSPDCTDLPEGSVCGEGEGKFDAEPVVNSPFAALKALKDVK